MDVVTALRELGGITSRKPLLRRVSRADLERAVAAGDVVRVTRGRYALPTDVTARSAAQALTGTAVLVTAAAHWDWARMWEPRRPQIAVPRGRNVSVAARADVELRWRDLAPDDVVDHWVTTRERTLLDCAALLPFELERYTRLVCGGWLVLRFTWYQVMTRPDWVAGMLAKAVAQRAGRGRAA